MGGGMDPMTEAFIVMGVVSAGTLLLFLLSAAFAMLPVPVIIKSPDLCANCRYDLRGLPTASETAVRTCPECGAAEQPSRGLRWVDSPARLRQLVAPAAAALFLAVILLPSIQLLPYVLDAASVRAMGYTWTTAWKVAYRPAALESVLVLVPLCMFVALSPTLFRARSGSPMSRFWLGLLLVGAPSAVALAAALRF
jgi:hypothetical protein